ncbi:NUDIX domain-containing protein [Patescibacteria group bacterium]|nr:NUDIX domain-containing protein [Patescibacteria group bacterium]MBU4452798.1 NUDIX domain-containing protein [Patescibacteria group bacterium]MCG2687505.1 NUDIX domain-containing protein [Candidatus Parcubacteria bacterium]
MINLLLEQIDQIRKSGFRPQVIGVILNKNRVLFCYKKDYDLWMFPQGGIDNKENIQQAFWREMSEELGDEFTARCNQELTFILKAKSKFPKDKQGSRPLATDGGESITLKGKVYFAITVESKTNKLDISRIEFDDYKWLNYQEAQELVATIYQSSKRRILSSIVEKVKEMGLIK